MERSNKMRRRFPPVPNGLLPPNPARTAPRRDAARRSDPHRLGSIRARSHALRLCSEHPSATLLVAGPRPDLGASIRTLVAAGPGRAGMPDGRICPGASGAAARGGSWADAGPRTPAADHSPAEILLHRPILRAGRLAGDLTAAVPVGSAALRRSAGERGLGLCRRAASRPPSPS